MTHPASETETPEGVGHRCSRSARDREGEASFLASSRWLCMGSDFVSAVPPHDLIFCLFMESKAVQILCMHVGYENCRWFLRQRNVLCRAGRTPGMSWHWGTSVGAGLILPITLSLFGPKAAQPTKKKKLRRPLPKENKATLVQTAHSPSSSPSRNPPTFQRSIPPTALVLLCWFAFVCTLRRGLLVCAVKESLKTSLGIGLFVFFSERHRQKERSVDSAYPSIAIALPLLCPLSPSRSYACVYPPFGRVRANGSGPSLHLPLVATSAVLWLSLSA